MSVACIVVLGLGHVRALLNCCNTLPQRLPCSSHCNQITINMQAPLVLLLLLQSPNTGPELFLGVLGTLAAACDAMTSSSNDEQHSQNLSQLIAVEDVLGLLQACLTSGAD